MATKARATSESGWRYTEPDGEASYVNCLLTTMAKAPKGAARIIAGSTLPDLARIAADPGELEWVSTLPFKYDQLDAEQVIEILVRAAGPNPVGISGRPLALTARLVTSDGEPASLSKRRRG